MILSRMRMQCSPLRVHLHNMHIIEEENCQCGHDKETVDHFFFNCPLYNETRHILEEIDAGMQQNSWLYLYGDRDATVQQNIDMLSLVTKFIVKSKRFD